jgi:phosphate uptake regulator
MFTVLEITTSGPGGLTRAIAQQAGRVESMVDHAIEALLSRDSGSATAILDQQAEANAMEKRIDQAIHVETAEGTVELCEATAMIRVNRDLARMRDMTVELARRLCEQPERKLTESGDHSELQPLAIAVSHLAKKTLRALARRDLLLAANAKSEKSRVDAYSGYIVNRAGRLKGTSAAIQENKENEENGENGLLFAAGFLEQIADQSMTIVRSLIAWLGGSESGEPIVVHMAV